MLSMSRSLKRLLASALSVFALSVCGVLASATMLTAQAPQKLPVKLPVKKLPAKKPSAKNSPAKIKPETAKNAVQSVGSRPAKAAGTKAGASAKKPTGKGRAGSAQKGSTPSGSKKKEIKTKDASKSEIPIPEGASEDDIRAIRGANVMRSTEKKLGALLKKMKVPGNVAFLKFDRLDAWPYEDGYKGMPKELKKFDGKRVAMAGFMLPIDEVEDIKTFYLVKSLWSCCYGIPPDVNGLVKINVKAKKGVAYQYDPILIVGTFRLKKVMDEDYTICIWQMDDAVVRVIDVD